MVETRLSNTQLTKIITIFPMFVIVNNLPYNIMYKEGASTTKDQVAHTADKERHDETDALVVPATAIQATTIWTLVEAGEVRDDHCVQVTSYNLPYMSLVAATLCYLSMALMILRYWLLSLP